jgi:hypothetical protein
MQPHIENADEGGPLRRGGSDCVASGGPSASREGQFANYVTHSQILRRRDPGS